MIDEPLITIAIPSFDRLEYLKEAVASALAQTYRNIEVLIGDDCPTRAAEGWARAMMEVDSRIRYQHNEQNLGLAGNWNALADSARGEFIVIIGDDDRLLPNFVEKLLELIESGTKVAFSNHFLINSDGARLDEESAAWTKRYRRDRLSTGVLPDAVACVWQNSVPISAALLRTRDVQRLRFKEELNTPEIEFFARLANEGAHFVFRPEYLAEYRTHGASATTNGLRSEALVKHLCDIAVPAHVEAIKSEFMAAVLVDAVSRSLRAGKRDAARRFLRNPYYPRTSRGLKPALIYLAQEVCANLPAMVGCRAYRLMQRAKAAI
jgi:glycosyltransferase involved in cell wall biosynthesis